MMWTSVAPFVVIRACQKSVTSGSEFTSVSVFALMESNWPTPKTVLTTPAAGVADTNPAVATQVRTMAALDTRINRLRLLMVCLRWCSVARHQQGRQRVANHSPPCPWHGWCGVRGRLLPVRRLAVGGLGSGAVERIAALPSGGGGTFRCTRVAGLRLLSVERRRAGVRPGPGSWRGSGA